MRAVPHCVRRAAFLSLENLEPRKLMAGIGLDFGDAPDTYRTTLAVNGARHEATPNLLLGNDVDIEPDGNPSPTADRDDLTGVVDDEDGILFLDPIVPGSVVDVQVTNGAAAGFLNAWFDFNTNGVFDAFEQIFTNVALPAASVTVQSFLVPTSATAGTSYSRFRLSGTVVPGVPTPFGAGGFGEVEDYCLNIQPPPTQAFEYGDAPDTYRTKLAVNGARHNSSPNIRLGADTDAELDGQPSIGANRDDLTGVPDDEDGVIFLSPIVQGGVATVQITNGGGAARLNAWMDFNANGFFDATEQIFTNVPMAGASVNVLNFLVPAGAATGTTYSRFRVNTAGGLAPFGFGGVGEVEDYQNKIDAAAPAKLDYGDLPNSYGTLLASNGARHFATNNLRLGARVDAEINGVPSVLADGDDLAAIDDEDGIVFLTPLVAGQVASVQVTNGAAAGRLNAWLDFNGNGFFNAGEQIFTNVLLAATSVNVLNFFVPAAANIGITYSRWRLNAGGGIGPIGHGGTGEVEDYQNRIEQQPQIKLDFGDAPDQPGGLLQYPTLLGGVSGNPARHTVVGGAPMLGTIIDAENDGQPNLAATGDDLNTSDDEDGVTSGGIPLELVQLTLGSVVQIDVQNGGASGGLLNAWFDFNQNGSWQAAEQVAINVPVPAFSTITINVAIPATLNPQLPLYSRFRIASAGGLQPTGAAQNGEVEDYASRLKAPPPAQLLDFGDAPELATAPIGYPTTLGGPSGNPARHIIQTVGPRLGLRIDPEADGQPNPAASGDDTGLLFGGIDDEDGVTVGGAPLETVALTPGAVLPVTVSNGSGLGGLLNAWFDWNGDFDWNDAGEQVATNVPVPPGSVFLPVAVPAGLAANANVYSRFRISTAAGLLPTGLADNGEVEDYVQKVNQDTTPPFVIDHKLEFETAQSLVVEFSEPMDPATVDLADIKAMNTDDGSTHTPVAMEWVYGTEIARFHFNMPGNFISDGDYEFDVVNMSDLGNNLLLPAVQLGGRDFFWKAGDASRDRKTDISDFATLASNFNRPGTFSDGNFDYRGNVDISDFAILASRFNTLLPRMAGISATPKTIGSTPNSGFGDLFGNEAISADVLN